MKISTRSRYGLRALIAIARSSGSATSEQIAKRENVSKKYLDEILRTLRQEGVLKGTRGPHGGYSLAVDPNDVSVLRLIEVLEGSIGLVECVDEPDVCSRSPDCPTRPLWTAATENLRDTFRGMTLSSFLGCEAEECCGPQLPLVDMSCPDAEAAD